MTKKPRRGAAPPRDLVVSHDGNVAVLRFPIDDAKLSAAEREVLLMMLAGRSNAEIAAARGTSDRTVANQVQSVFKKLGVRSRAQLAAWMAVARPR
jgi:DNA-binding CsgD family transcriptional regulator